MISDASPILDAALRRLQASVFAQQATRAMRRDQAGIGRAMLDSILEQIPAYSRSQNPDVVADLSEHGPAHIEEIIRLLGGGALGNFAFVREHAERRATQHFPLEANLHAYRCGHKVVSQYLHGLPMAKDGSSRQVNEWFAAVADFTLEYTDAISTIAAGSYVAQTRLQADVEGDQRAALMRVLLEGYDESDGRVETTLRRSGFLDQRQSYCVVLAQALNQAEMENPARARRLAESISEILVNNSLRYLIDVRDHCVTVILSAPRRASGWTAPNAKLATRIAGPLATLGTGILVGISNDAPSTASVPGAHRQAKLALDLASVKQRLVQFGSIPVHTLTVHFAREDLSRVLPSWTDDLIRADEKAKGALTDSLRGYADADMNVLRAAQSLAVHPNTLYARFQKITEITTLDPRAFHPLSELLLVIECMRA